METLNEEDELLSHIHSLTQHPGWLHIVKNIEAFKNQALQEILTKDNTAKEKGEFTAYGRILNLPQKLIQDMTTVTPNINFDPYHDSSRDTTAR